MKSRAQLDAERSRVNERLAQAHDWNTQRGLEALRLFEAGWSNPEIAGLLGVTERTARNIRSDALSRTSAGADPHEGPYTRAWVDWRDHSRECRQAWDDQFEGVCDHGEDINAMVDAAVDGYEQFFNTFNREGLLLTDHARYWVWCAFRHVRLLLNVPPRHAKSTYLSVWLPLFLVSADRQMQVLVISQTGDFAKKFCRMIAQEMKDNQELIAAYGRYKPLDTKRTWSPSQGELACEGLTTGDRSIQVRGARQQVLGMEADWITCDDPDDPDIARSEIERTRLRNWYEEQVVSRLTPGAHVTVIGQRVGINDIYGYLADKTADVLEGRPKVYKHILTPAVLDWEKEEVLWPEVWPFDRLIKERYADNPAKFETMYQQNPTTEGQAIFDPGWINGDADHVGCLDIERPAGGGMVVDNERQDFPIVRVVSVDPSPTQYSAFIVADVIHNYQEFHASLIHVESEKIHGREILNHIDWLIDNYHPDYLIIEDSAVSKWIFQDPWYESAKYRVHVRAHNTNAHNKGDPEWGVQSLAIDFEFGRIRFPWGDAEGRIMSQTLLREMYSYDSMDKSRDDCIMALWFIRFAHRSLVPSLQLQGGFEVTHARRISPVVARAMKRKDTEEERIRKWREQKHASV